MLAVCLITADRPQYTNRTLTSFAEQNSTTAAPLILLHADDGSKDNANECMASACGFKTVYRSKVRHGVMPALSVMWQAARDCGATHILHLENDIEFCAPLPTRRDADSVRLYGAFKGANETYRTGPYIMETKTPINWQPDSPGWERARCHWGAQPSITRADLLVDAILRAYSLKDVSRRLIALDTVRPVVNIANHIGVEKTKGAKFSA